jgi:hypothetical protein
LEQSRILAGVEIEYPPDGRSWEDSYDHPVRRLLKLMDVGLIKNAYLVIFAIVRLLRDGRIKDRRDWYEAQLALLKKKWNTLWRDTNLKIYCVPGDTSKEVKPVWIPSV